MVVYNYDDNGMYLYSSKAQENPKNKGTFLMPANSTDIKPSENKEGFVQIFKNNKWEYIRNYTQTDVYSTETGQKADNYKELGELPSTLTDKVPPESYPKWTGTEWIIDEDKKLKDETEAEIIRLEKELSDSDYKIIKLYEASLLGLEPEYDINEVYTQRQACRDEINKLEASLA